MSAPIDRGNGHAERVCLETKDGRRFLVWIEYPGGKEIRAFARYRTRTQAAIFDFAGVLYTDTHAYQHWRQRRGRSQPRLLVTPSDWLPRPDRPRWTDNRGQPFERRPRRA